MDGSTSESDGNLTQEDEPEGSQANSNFDRSDSIRSKTVLNRELDKYLAEPMWPRGSDPMVWWANHVSEYKMMKNAVLKYLSAPPERLFSAAARVYTENRNKLLPQNAERLIRLMKNNTLMIGKISASSLVEEEFF